MAYERKERSDRSERGERGERPERGGPRRKKTCPFTGPAALTIDWKDVRMLGRFINEKGKIAPARVSAVAPAKQRELARAIKRARFMALMPFTRDEAPYQDRGDRPDRGERTPRYSERGE